MQKHSPLQSHQQQQSHIKADKLSPLGIQLLRIKCNYCWSSFLLFCSYGLLTLAWVFKYFVPTPSEHAIRETTSNLHPSLKPWWNLLILICWSLRRNISFVHSLFILIEVLIFLCASSCRRLRHPWLPANDHGYFNEEKMMTMVNRCWVIRRMLLAFTNISSKVLCFIWLKQIYCINTFSKLMCSKDTLRCGWYQRVPFMWTSLHF